MLVVTTWYPSPSAPESGAFIQRDVRMLRERHDVRVLHLAQPGIETGVEDDDGVPVTRVTMRRSSPIAVRRARRAVREAAVGVELVHSMSISSLLPLSRGVGLPWVHTEHWSALLAPETAPLAARLVGGVLVRRLGRPEVVVAVSDALARLIARYRRGPIEVIPNAVPAPTSRRHAGEAGRVRLVSVGGLIERKQPLMAVAVVDELRRRGRDVSLVLVGDGPLRAAVEQDVRARGLDGAVRLAGTIAPDEVSAYLADADVFFTATRSETFGVAIAEALRHGLPVVAGGEGGHREFIGPADGVLVDSDTPPAYADAVESALALAADGDAIARRAEERFSDAARQDAYDAVYRLAVERRAA